MKTDLLLCLLYGAMAGLALHFEDATWAAAMAFVCGINFATFLDKLRSRR